MIDKHMLILIGSVSLMFMAVIVILSVSIGSSNRNFNAIEDNQEIMNITLSKIDLAAPQSNFTAQKEAVERIEGLTEDMDLVFSMVTSMNNKIDELFFLRDVTDPTTNTFNLTNNTS